MKTFKSFAYLMAIAIVGVAVSSCKQKEEVQGNNYNGEVVKSEFTISIPNNAAGGAKKMKGTMVQDGAASDISKFRGITDMTLVPFADANEITSTENRIGDNIVLGNIAAAGTDMNNTNANVNSKVFTNVSIPLTTSSFLVYGQATYAGSNKFESGSLTPVINTATPDGFSFSLEPIQSTLTTITSNAGYVGLLAYLNSIISAEDDAAKKWYEYADMADNVVPNIGMKNMVIELTELKHITSFNVARMLTDLRKSLEPITTTLATNIKAAIDNTTYITAATVAPDFTVTLKDDYNNFPASLNIPEGGVLSKWNPTAHEFQAAASADYTSQPMTEPIYFTYPSSLWYYANSTIRTSKTSQKDNYAGKTAWADVLNLHTDGGSVNTLTRAVAIEDRIQYGVGRLDVYVKSNTPLKDNNPVVAQRDITPNGSGWDLSAVLVGGQKNVGFDFTPKGTQVYTIYDKDILASNVPVSASYPATPNNYTLVLETAPATTEVYIAIELTNNTGTDFYGADGNIIPKNGKFYLLGSLKQGASPAGNQTAGSLDRIFKQDYYTIAKLTITKLSAAYNTIPDLKTPELELGLSVDLEWQQGNTYEVEL